MHDIDNAYEYIIKKTNVSPKIGLILGSGLGDFVDSLDSQITIDFDEIPNFPKTTVQGHSGQFVFGKFKGIDIVTLRGRIHFYEGYTMQQITIPARVMSKFGVKHIIITNAAGGINKDFSVGDFMIIEDHINFSGSNPLIGKNLDEFGQRFPDCTNIYSTTLREKLKKKAEKNNIKLQQGVYLMCSGPSYETPAEIRMFEKWGADAVGMSTVPEAIVAAHCGIKVIGISCITNLAAGISKESLSHAEVIEIADKSKPKFKNLINLAIEVCGE